MKIKKVTKNPLRSVTGNEEIGSLWFSTNNYVYRKGNQNTYYPIGTSLKEGGESVELEVIQIVTKEEIVSKILKHIDETHLR